MTKETKIESVKSVEKPSKKEIEMREQIEAISSRKNHNPRRF